MGKRLYSGSLLGLNRSALHTSKKNMCVYLYLDQSVDKEKLQKALDKAVIDCPFATLSVKEDSGIFLCLEENDKPLKVLQSMPQEINCAENDGHSVAVWYDKNIIGINITHSLTDGCGIFWLTRTLLDYYFGKDTSIYQGSSQKDYDIDPLENDFAETENYERPAPLNGSYLTVEEAKKNGEGDIFCLQVPYAQIKALCKNENSSVQNMITMLGVKAVSEAYSDGSQNVVVRLPINARGTFEIPNSFQNASLANMRISFTGQQLKEEDSIILKEIAEQSAKQNTMDEIFYQYKLWKKVILTEDHDERMKNIIPLMGQDALVISNMGKGLVDDSYSEHIINVYAGLRVFPLMIYGVVLGDRMIFSGYDASERGKFKKGLKTVLEKRGLSVEELDSTTDKAI